MMLELTAIFLFDLTSVIRYFSDVFDDIEGGILVLLWPRLPLSGFNSLSSFSVFQVSAESGLHNPVAKTEVDPMSMAGHNFHQKHKEISSFRV